MGVGPNERMYNAYLHVQLLRFVMLFLRADYKSAKLALPHPKTLDLYPFQLQTSLLASSYVRIQVQRFHLLDAIFLVFRRPGTSKKLRPEIRLISTASRHYV